MMEYYDLGYGMGSFGWLVMILFMILFWGAIIWLIVWLVNRNKHQTNQSSDKTPSEILKERYAKGELSKKEYFEIKNELSK
jgi:putative membrane protein